MRAWEDVLHQTLEKRKILSNQFWDECATETLQKDALLPLVVNLLSWIGKLRFLLSLQVTCADQNTLECSEAEVIMTLRAELIQAQIEK